MGVWRKTIGGGGYQDTIQYKMSSAVAEGQIIIRDATLTNAGEVDDSGSATAALNTLGCAMDTGTYTSTQATDMVEGLTRCCQSPFAVWEFNCSGNSTTGTALVVATTTPSNILVNSTASAGGTLLTTASVGLVQRTGAILKGRTGANAGLTRKVSAHTDNTSCSVTVPFPNAIAVNDSFLCVGYGTQIIDLRATANAGTPASALPAYADANGTTGTDNTSIPVEVVAVIINEMLDTAVVQCVMRTHWLNSLA